RGAPVLTGGYGQTAAAQPLQVGVALGRVRRLLEPTRPQLHEARDVLPSALDGPVAVDVHGDGHAVSSRAPARRDVRQGDLVQLQVRDAIRQRQLAGAWRDVGGVVAYQAGVEAHRLGPRAGGEQFVERHLLALGLQVPQSDVHARDGEHRHAVAAEEV